MEIQAIISFFIWICLFGGMHSEAQEPTEPTPNPLTITKIFLNTDSIDVYFKVDPTHAPVGTVFDLIVGTIPADPNDHGQTNEYSMADGTYSVPNDANVETSVSFTGAFVEHQGENLYFTIHGDPPADPQSTYGNYNRSVAAPVVPVEVIVYANLGAIPSTASGTAQWVGENTVSRPGNGHGNTLRTTEVANGWKICGNSDTVVIDEMTCNDAEAPCYAINIGSEVKGNELFYCDTTDTDKPIIVKSSLSPDDVASKDGPDVTDKSISLDYETPKITTNIVKLQTEAFVYKSDQQIGYICSDAQNCLLSDYAKGDNMLKIVFNKVEAGDGATAATGSTVVSLQDVDIHAYQLAPAVLESRWNNHADAYLAEKSEVTDDNSFHFVDANCQGAGICYAYFVNIEVEGDYKVTTKPLVGENPDEKNAVTSLKAHVAIAKENRAIHAEPTSIIVIETNIALDVCSTYITNTSSIDTHYEFLAVNGKGKWKKEIGYKKKDDSHACFHGVKLPLADFSESSKFFVILRDSNNGEPLASEEITFDLPAPRDIKPEVDNGSNGSSSTLAIVGAAIAGIACLMALVAVAVMFVMKINGDNDGLEYPLHRHNIEDSSFVYGLDNPIPAL